MIDEFSRECLGIHVADGGACSLVILYTRFRNVA